MKRQANPPAHRHWWGGDGQDQAKRLRRKWAELEGADKR